MTQHNVKEVWQPNFYLNSHLFASVANFAALFYDFKGFPSAEELTALLPVGCSGSGQKLRFVAQPSGRRKVTGLAGLYEARGFLCGEVLTKEGRWHDFLHALIWASFPKSKAALSWRAFWAFDDHNLFPWHTARSQRSRVQDALTLFDEGGVCVIYDDPFLWELLQQRRWKELWWHQRSQHNRRICYVTFGHALLEEAVKEHRTAHASGVGLLAPSAFFGASFHEKMQWIDLELSKLFLNNKCFFSPAALTPVPVWGIPGWAAESEDSRYYENQSYFR